MGRLLLLVCMTISGLCFESMHCSVPMKEEYDAFCEYGDIATGLPRKRKNGKRSLIILLELGSRADGMMMMAVLNGPL